MTRNVARNTIDSRQGIIIIILITEIYPRRNAMPFDIFVPDFPSVWLPEFTRVALPSYTEEAYTVICRCCCSDSTPPPTIAQYGTM